MPTVSVDTLSDLVSRALGRAGFSDGNAGPVAATIVASERDGVPSHGLLRLPGFVDAVQTRWADGQASPRIVGGSPGTILVDAGNGFAQPALALAKDRLETAAQAYGVATLLVRNAYHFAALAPDIEGFAEGGFVVLTCVNSRRRMSAWGGNQPVLGTNAMAFATPRAGHPPLVWDQSSSVMSQGDLLLAARDKRPVATGVGLDRDGEPTTSAAAILEGTLSPFGGNKGASVAAMVEILAAALTGSYFGFETPEAPHPGAPSKCGQFLLLIDPAASGANVATRTEALAAAIIGAGAGRLPGDRRYEARRLAEAEGIRVNAAAYETLLELSGSV